MKQIASIVLVLAIAALWSVAQSPKVRPTRANCYVQDMYLGAISHYPYWHFANPDSVRDRYPKSRNEFSLWTWEKHPGLEQLRVTLQDHHIVKVRGTDLMVESRHFLKAGAPLSDAQFLGSPSRMENEVATWWFPELEIDVFFDDAQRVTFIEISSLSPEPD